MAFFKKQYTPDQIQILKCELFLNTGVAFSESVKLHNQLIHAQKVKNTLLQLAEATGQNMIEYENHIYKINEDGTIYYVDNNKSFTYDE